MNKMGILGTIVPKFAWTRRRTGKSRFSSYALPFHHTPSQNTGFTGDTPKFYIHRQAVKPHQNNAKNTPNKYVILY